MLNNSEALKYIDGVALHWYFDKIADPQLLNFVYTDKKELELIMSEACKYIKICSLQSRAKQN